MKERHPSTAFPGEGGDHKEPLHSENRAKARKRHRAWRCLGLILLLLLIALGIGRACLPDIIRDYVNRTLDRNLLYEGRIGDVQVHLWRGAYSINNIHISQRSGNVPVPLLSAKRVDFSIQWDALLHGRVVGQFVMQEPELNFVAASDENESQTGNGGPWLEMIRDLFPFTINSAVIQNGSVRFRAYQSQKPVDVYLTHVEATIDDLGNIREQTNPMEPRCKRPPWQWTKPRSNARFLLLETPPERGQRTSSQLLGIFFGTPSSGPTCLAWRRGKLLWKTSSSRRRVLPKRFRLRTTKRNEDGNEGLGFNARKIS